MAKKILLNISFVLVVVFFLDFSIGRTLRHFYFSESSGPLYRTTYSLEKTNADILVFGASRANHHYIPEIFEDSLKMSFYNTGRDGNGVFYQEAVLLAVLKRYTPKVILLDYAGDFDKGSRAYDALSTLLPYYRTHQELRKIIELKSPFEKYKLVSEIYPFNSEILTLAMGNLEFNKKLRYDNKGYIPLYKTWKLNIDSTEHTPPYVVDSTKLNSFKSFIKLAKASKVKVFVIYSPVFEKFKKSQEIDICRDVCLSENIPFWDYSKDSVMVNNRLLFEDIMHLNNTGAVFFSNIIVKRVKQNLVINKHHQKNLKFPPLFLY